MLDTNIKAQLAAYLEKLQRPIELVAALDASDASVQMRALLDDIASLSTKVAVRTDDNVAGVRVPSFGIAAAGESPRIRFAGLPLGHEFTSLVLALLHVGGHPPKTDEATLARIRALSSQAFETYVSLVCHNCPDVVQAFNLMAAVNPAITHTMIDGALFQDEVAARQILAVPAAFRGGEDFIRGRSSLDEILDRLDGGAAAPATSAEPYDVLVVGGGPAGAAAAIYAARKGIRTGIVAERFGGQVADTLGIENFISVDYTEGPKLVAAMEAHVKQYDVDILRGQRAATLLPAGDDGMASLRLDSGATLRARSIVLATGARWREMNVPGEQEYRGKGVAYCPHCDGPLFKGKRVAVIGGGNSGVEAAIDLAGIVAHVTLIEFDTQLRADAVLQARLKSLPNVDVIVNAQTTEVTGSGGKVDGLIYKDRTSGESHRVDLAGVFVQIGLLPNTDWLKGSVERSRFGEIVIDARGATSMPGVFAAGDCTTVPYKQIVISMGEGAKAALSAFDHLIRTPLPASVEPAAA